MRDRRGQMMIVAIVAIVIVATIILFFLLSGRGIDVVERQDFDNPESFIDQCVRESLRETVAVMLPQGGFVNPEDTVFYEDVSVPYLCKNINHYEPCITQYPRYITQLQQELNRALQDPVEDCFILLEEELDQRNYDYSGRDVTIESVLKPGVVEVNVLREFTLTRDGVTRAFNSFVLGTPSYLYDIAWVANEIASQEARFCNFEYVGFSALYPEFDIRKTTLSDSTKIYTLMYKTTGEVMYIATRGCVIPAGF